LRCGQPNTRRVAHGLFHVLDELLDLCGRYFLGIHRPGCRSQNWFSHLNDFQAHSRSPID
jgi:hypothetical protein